MAKKLIARKGSGRSSEVFAVDATPSPTSHDWEEVGSSAEVFEVTDLLIPAGTDWRHEGHVLGQIELGPFAEVHASFSLALQDPPAGTEDIVLAAIDGADYGPASEWISVNIGNPDRFSRYATATLVDDNVANAGAAVPGSTTLYVGLYTDHVITQDITVIRARAAFLVI